MRRYTRIQYVVYSYVEAWEEDQKDKEDNMLNKAQHTLFTLQW